MGQESAIDTNFHISSTIFNQFTLRNACGVQLVQPYKPKTLLDEFNKYLTAETQSKYLVKMGRNGTLAGEMGQYAGEKGHYDYLLVRVIKTYLLFVLSNNGSRATKI